MLPGCVAFKGNGSWDTEVQNLFIFGNEYKREGNPSNDGYSALLVSRIKMEQTATCDNRRPGGE